MINVFSSNQTFESFNELYFVTHLMGSDLNNIIRTQRLTDDHVRFLTYQVGRKTFENFFKFFVDFTRTQIYSFGRHYSS